jgi:hypothetical protein
VSHRWEELRYVSKDGSEDTSLFACQHPLSKVESCIDCSPTHNPWGERGRGGEPGSYRRLWDKVM